MTTISVLSFCAAVSVAFLLLLTPAHAAGCLSAKETRQAIATGKAQHLAAIKAASQKVVRGDVVKAQLCDDGGALVYRLTILSRQGTVSRITLNANSGKVLSKNGF